MKPKLPYLFVLFCAVITLACSPDDDNTISKEIIGEFTFNGQTYDLASIIITSENTSSNETGEIGINLFNKTSTEVTSNTNLSDVSYVYFSFEDVNIQNTTYNQIDDYNISINSSFIDDEFNPGTILLSDSDSESDLYAQSGSITVTNFTQFNIAFTFTFTRNDEEVISGSYDGPHFMPQS